jgi:ABC-type glycerol-3-phosphate transport system substrate-binding protein
VTSFTGDGTELFSYIGDTIAINGEAPNLELATEFAAFALSVDGQIAFNEQKGSTPAIIIDDPRTEIKNVTLRETYEEMQAAVDAGTFIESGGWRDECGPIVRRLRPKLVNADGELVDNPDLEMNDLEAMADELLEVYQNR